MQPGGFLFKRFSEFVVYVYFIVRGTGIMKRGAVNIGNLVAMLLGLARTVCSNALHKFRASGILKVFYGALYEH